ncbi:Glu/Leu/Phe/Val dehydrogenase, partial [Chloroflexota bacterium]
SDEEIGYMLRHIGMKVFDKVARARTGYFTSLSVLAATKSAARYVGMELGRCTVAIEGFGKVGSSLANELSKEGARVVAVSTSEGAIYSEKGLDVGELTRLYKELGSSFIKSYSNADLIEKGQLLELKVDVLSPCAEYHSIDSDKADRIQARVVCSGANIPAMPEAEQILYQKGVLSVPYFAANCGGVLGG